MRWGREDINVTSKRSASDDSVRGRFHGRLDIVSCQIEDEPSLARGTGDDAVRGELHFGSILLVTVAIVVVGGHDGTSRRSSSCDYAVVVHAVLVLRLILRLGGVERDSSKGLFRISSPVRPHIKLVIHFDDTVDDGHLLALGARNVDGSGHVIAVVRIAASSVVESATILGSGSGSSVGSAVAFEPVFGDEEIDNADEDVEEDENGQDDGDDEVDGDGLVIVVCGSHDDGWVGLGWIGLPISV